jgi:hypothetical protein
MAKNPDSPHGHFPTVTDKYLQQVLVGNDPGSPPYEKALILLQQRSLKRQSGRLACATWALVGATVLLAILTGVQAWATWLCRGGG